MVRLTRVVMAAWAVAVVVVVIMFAVARVGVVSHRELSVEGMGVVVGIENVVV